MFDALYSVVICPVFITEAVADLSKAPTADRTVEKMVRDLANKTPPMHSSPTMLHTKVCRGELAGYPVEMRGFPVRGDGRVVRHNGKLALIHDETSEA
ncbi:hypothetical protein, partial [Bosea sp. TAB14]|uniref:hypothetical protein n=1 Tax=Bosea sp. TAB14 TaxID=3237481 RepID=UPI003F902C35